MSSRASRARREWWWNAASSRGVSACGSAKPRNAPSRMPGAQRSASAYRRCQVGEAEVGARAAHELGLQPPRRGVDRRQPLVVEPAAHAAQALGPRRPVEPRGVDLDVTHRRLACSTGSGRRRRPRSTSSPSAYGGAPSAKAACACRHLTARGARTPPMPSSVATGPQRALAAAGLVVARRGGRLVAQPRSSAATPPSPSSRPMARTSPGQVSQKVVGNGPPGRRRGRLLDGHGPAVGAARDDAHDRQRLPAELGGDALEIAAAAGIAGKGTTAGGRTESAVTPRRIVLLIVCWSCSAACSSSRCAATARPTRAWSRPGPTSARLGSSTPRWSGSSTRSTPAPPSWQRRASRATSSPARRRSPWRVASPSRDQRPQLALAGLVAEGGVDRPQRERVDVGARSSPGGCRPRRARSSASRRGRRRRRCPS